MHVTIAAAAKGLAQVMEPSRLSKNGGPATLSVSWAKSLLNRMNFTKRRGSTKTGMAPDDLESAKKTFISETIVLNDIPVELIFNWGLTWFLVHCGPLTKGGKNELTFQDLRIKDKLLSSCVGASWVKFYLHN